MERDGIARRVLDALERICGPVFNAGLTEGMLRRNRALDVASWCLGQPDPAAALDLVIAAARTQRSTTWKAAWSAIEAHRAAMGTRAR